MKTLVKIILVAGIVFPTFLFGQSDHFSKKNAIKLSPVEFRDAEFQMTYEHYFKDRSSSIVFMPSVILKDDYNEKKEGFQIGLQYRTYLTHFRRDESPVFLGFYNLGFYAGVYAEYLNYKEDYTFSWYDSEQDEHINRDFTKKAKGPEGGAIIGIQIDVTQRFIMDFFVGGGIKYTTITDTKNDVVNPADYYDSYGLFEPEYKGVKPRIGLQLGFTF